MKRHSMKCILSVCFATVIAFHAGTSAFAVRIRDVARLENDVPNEIVGEGLVLGLPGTGDGGDYVQTMEMLMSLMKKFDDPVVAEKELKNANNVAIVQLAVTIPSEGAHAGERLDVKVMSIGAAKSLKGGRLFISPLIAPRTDIKIILGSASGEVTVDDDKHPTSGTIHGGGVLIKDILPTEIKNGQFTLVLHPNTANMETASAVADQINEDVSPETGGKAVALAVDATSVTVNIPKAELANTTGFIARIRNLPLPNIPEPAKVVINTSAKTIVFTSEVELAPTTISFGAMTIEITAPPPAANGVVDPRQYGNAKLKDLMEAFDRFKVSADQRIAIVKLLHDTNVLKADLEIQ